VLAQSFYRVYAAYKRGTVKALTVNKKPLFKKTLTYEIEAQ